MDLEQLHYFRTAARLQHLRAAADELGVSQSALSRSIARLEESYGVKLFDRVGRGVRLNEYGRVLLAGVARALASLDDVERELTDLAGMRAREVTLGFLGSFGGREVPALISDYRVRHPDVRVRLLQGSFPYLQERMLAGEIDVCLASPRFPNAEIEWQALWKEELVAVLPPSHPLASRESLALEELAHEPMVALKPGYGLRLELDEMARRSGFTPRIEFESDEAATLAGLVGAGFGVALLPRSISGQGVRITLNAGGVPCFRSIGLSWLRDRYTSPAIVAFRNRAIAILSRRGSGDDPRS
ncbi:MAG: LysR family transcriptional regulator [Vulcanimicrobiaceae bacterium]